ncbi:MAG: YqgE/AlgH family protein [Lysobacterales bacterium CG02_land_8_20_14_3_00_62_12]|nr:MAG: YqgE/AlgH family protein [Xanthomonadales bacterium CG02_land_8_20_14_3_00_62_12]PJA37358.1 MAG: YqgE/AlgH family protein [Xanthomonadales bacterium CG_4_9_14_3_um_filter_62_6]
MTESTWLSHQLLIAMPGMLDPRFEQSVVYLCQHNHDGAMGLIVNRASGLRFSDVLEQMQISPADPTMEPWPVLIGGPVQPERGFVLHTALAGAAADDPEIITLSPGLALSTSRDVLEALATHIGTGKALLALGYAGWSAGQLEQEVLANAWLTVPLPEPALLFDIPIEQRWERAAQLAGIDLSRLSSQAGHA